MRPIRALALTAAGTVLGAVAAAAFVKRAVPSRGGADSDELALVAIFDGIELESRATAFTGGSVLAWFGGVALDLRGATPSPDARLVVHALCGGVAIRVPAGWRVESGLRGVAGGVDVRTPEPDGPQPPTLRVDGLALFGGIAVTAKREDDGAEPAAA